MNGRELVDRLVFDAPSYDAAGSQDGWTPSAYECRGKIRYLRGGETVQAARLDGKQPVVVTIRKSDDAEAIDTDWIMRDPRRDEKYNIRAVVPTEDRRWLEITAESGVAR